MKRREFAVGVLSLAVANRAMSAHPAAAGPLFYMAARHRATVFILGVGEAKDDSWETPSVRRAFEESSDLWLEVGQEPGPADAAAQREQLAHDPAGRSFFDVLEPKVRVRAMEYCAQLAIPPEKLGSLRPWSAFYTLNAAYWSQHEAPEARELPDETLKKLAKEQGKPIHYEMPDQLAFARFMAAMPDAAQSQYITFLLDYLDDQTAGRNQGDFDWTHGDTTAGWRAVDRMRTRTPDLYRAMQVDRNGWWAEEIDRLLTSGGTHFIAIGQMHVLGPDGIPKQLRRRGVVKPRELTLLAQ